MIQICDDAYWKGMEALKPPGAPCGVRFDDLHQWTICPHILIGYRYVMPSILEL